MNYNSKSFEDVSIAFHEVAQHLDIPISAVTRKKWEKAVSAGWRGSMSPRTARNIAKNVGGWRELRDRIERAAPATDRTQAVPLHPLPEGQDLRGVSTLVDSEGNVKLQWVKTKPESENLIEIYRSLFTELAKDVKAVKPTPVPTVTNDDVLDVIPLGDPHVGLQTWAAECGDSFDLDICEQIMYGALDHLVGNVPASKKCMIVNLGDYFHADDDSQRTKRSGHKLDVDGRWAKVLGVGLRIISRLIDRALEVYEEVVFHSLPGNHDDHSSMFLQIALNERYRNEPRVTIEVTPRIFQYVKWGKCLIGMTHGHTVKHTALGEVMATDVPQDWGNTQHRYWYVGHLHHSRKTELRGCMVEIFRTMAAPDAYAVGHGYRSGRDMTKISLHKDWGEISRSTITASALQAQLASTNPA